MHHIEPHFGWRDYYRAEDDPNSPFYGREYSEFEFTNKVYNYLLHPQWDRFGSDTLLFKILFVDYDEGYAIIEFIGEWNDCINNDIMFLKRDILDEMIGLRVNKFIFIGENVLNFHGSDDSYYEELREDIEDGWAVFLHFLPHVVEEMHSYRLQDQVHIEEDDEFTFDWRRKKPEYLYGVISRQIGRQHSLELE
ncbi:MAG: hypothetical protein H6606_10525 [Flavobacteriales bacterium]|nr:hypothetical protein [Flavobacteriales bacterium]